MNRYQELKENQTALAVLGLNHHSLDIAKNTSEYGKVMIGNLSSCTGAPYQADDKLFDSNKIQWVNGQADLRGAGIYYVDSVSNSINDWSCIKETMKQIGASLNYGDWVVFGQGIDADLAEVVLVENLERTSGLRLGMGFEIAFCPALVQTTKFDNLSNEMKLSHNLIIGEVEQILNFKSGGEFGSNQLNFRDPKKELEEIKSKVLELWVPMLNQMTEGTFREFFRMTINNNFLDAYTHLKMSNEHRVDWKRFFSLAVKGGLKHQLASLIKEHDVRLAS